MLETLGQSVDLLLRWDIYFYISAGLVVGMFVGAMPGLTTILAMAVLLPISFKLEPMLGIPFLIGVYKGGIYGGSIPAILVGIPGTGASIATTFDGPQLTRQGKGAQGAGNGALRLGDRRRAVGHPDAAADRADRAHHPTDRPAGSVRDHRVLADPDRQRVGRVRDQGRDCRLHRRRAWALSAPSRSTARRA